jgi:co-chaperonin GroES (HSP10)
MTIQPQSGHIFIEHVEPAEARGTVFVPETIKREERNGGKIVAVAEHRIGRDKDGSPTVIPMMLKGCEGQYAIFRPRQADVFAIRGKTYYCVHEDYVLATFPTLKDFQRLTALPT